MRLKCAASNSTEYIFHCRSCFYGSCLCCLLFCLSVFHANHFRFYFQFKFIASFELKTNKVSVIISIKSWFCDRNKDTEREDKWWLKTKNKKSSTIVKYGVLEKDCFVDLHVSVVFSICFVCCSFLWKIPESL